MIRGRLLQPEVVTHDPWIALMRAILKRALQDARKPQSKHGIDADEFLADLIGASWRHIAYSKDTKA